MNTPKENVSLYYCDAGSDKEYHAAINEVDGGFTVTFAYGRRGSALSTGVKTISPVDYIVAKKIFDKLISEKTAKGYSPSAGSKLFTATDNENRVSGLVPQLLNPITEEEAVSYLTDDNWVMQPKYDGKRIMVKVEGGKAVGSNRKGLTVSLPQELETSLLSLQDCEIDGELIGNSYKVFDCLSVSGKDIRSHMYIGRHEMLGQIIGAKSKYIEVSPLYTGTAMKRYIFEQLKESRAEGVVFKRLNSASVPGRPASGGNQLKCKFYATCTCSVLELNDQRSVQLAMSDGKHVGNVTIPPNKDIPVKGELVEIKYLYAYKGEKGKLYQPTYLGVRDDLDNADDRSTLKLKAEDTDEE